MAARTVTGFPQLETGFPARLLLNEAVRAFGLLTLYNYGTLHFHSAAATVLADEPTGQGDDAILILQDAAFPTIPPT